MKRIAILVLALLLTANQFPIRAQDVPDPEANKALVLRVIEEFVNEKDFGLISELIADDFALYFNGWTEPSFERRSGYRTFWSTYVFSVYPDFHITTHDIIAEDDRVAVRVTATGTHTGSVSMAPATGNEVVLEQIHIYRVADGQIVEWWVTNDMVTNWAQLEALSRAAEMIENGTMSDSLLRFLGTALR